MSKVPGVDRRKMKSLLVERREELLMLLDAGIENRTDNDLDQQRIGRLSRMDSIQQQAMEDETARRREKDLQRILAALDRIESDDYGNCPACGEIIAVKRLQNDPGTPMCINCAQKVS